LGEATVAVYEEEESPLVIHEEVMEGVFAKAG
jgi:hypothetical protein